MPALHRVPREAVEQRDEQVQVPPDDGVRREMGDGNVVRGVVHTRVQIELVRGVGVAFGQSMNSLMNGFTF